MGAFDEGVIVIIPLCHGARRGDRVNAAVDTQHHEFSQEIFKSRSAFKLNGIVAEPLRQRGVARVKKRHKSVGCTSCIDPEIF